MNEATYIAIKVVADILYAKGILSGPEIDEIYSADGLDDLYDFLASITSHRPSMECV